MPSSPLSLLYGLWALPEMFLLEQAPCWLCWAVGKNFPISECHCSLTQKRWALFFVIALASWTLGDTWL